MVSCARSASTLYWSVAVALTVFGFVDLVAIGAPFFLVGVTLLIVGPFRHRPSVLWSALAGVLSFIAVVIVLMPLGCTSSGTASPRSSGDPGPVHAGHTVCSNVIGIDYSGTVGYRPTLVPALVAGTLAAAAVALLANRMLRRRPDRLART